jgi:phosphate transport system substrate-binding protein
MTRTTKRPLAVLALLALLAMILAACGNTGTGTGATTEAPTTAAVAEPTAAPAAEPTAAAAEPTPAADAGATTGGVALPEVDPGTVTGNIVTAGSSTVFPLSQRMAERFKSEGYAGNITIDEIGTGAGFERFCKTGETDIANASRAIKQEEIDNCAKLSPARTPVEFRIGTDALSVVVSSDNAFLKGLTLEQLAKIYNAEVKTWDQVDPSYPKEQIQLFSPGSDSGTYDYFVEVVLNKDAAMLEKSGAQFSENDNVLVQGVEGSPNAIGYFGFAYYNANKGKLRAIPIEGVEPNETTAEDGTYKLSRPLFLYSDATIMKEKPQVAAFINFYLTSVNDEIEEAGYFPASSEALDTARQNFLKVAGQ